MNKPEVKTQYYESGAIRIKHYYLNGEQHNPDGPAVIWYYESGEVEIERYYLNSKRHRTDGPAIIWYHESGVVREEYYWINDESATKKQVAEIKFNLQFDKDLEEVLTK